MNHRFTSNLSIINERRIRAFLAVAEELSFTRAAQRLFIAQQPLSKNIAELESDLGVRLLHRTTRHVSLTDAGKVAYNELIDLLERHESMRRRVSRAARGDSGQLAVGSGNYGMNSVLPQLLRTYHERYPDVTINIENGQAMTLFDLLANRDIDIAFALLPLAREDLAMEPVYESGWLVITSDNLPLPGSDVPTPLSHFRDFGFVNIPRSRAPGVDDLRKTLFAEADFVPRFVQSASELPTMLTLAAAGLGILLMPADSVPVRQGGIKRVPIATAHRAVLYVVTRRDEFASSVVRNFWNLTLELRDSAHWLDAKTSL